MMADAGAIEFLADIPVVQASRLGDAPALVQDGRTISFRDLHAGAQATARSLLASGIAPGDRVAVLNRNDLSWFDLFFGSVSVRAALVPINCRLAAAEIGFILSDAAPRLLFVGGEFADIALQAAAELTDPPRLILLDGARDGFETYADWAGQGSDAQLPHPAVEDDVLQLYTSGTTGKPKGVVLTNRNYRQFLRAMERIDGFSYEIADTVMIVMPLFHVAGTNVSFAGLAQGCRLLIVRDFVPDQAIAAMQAERVAHAFLAPAIIQMMLHSPAIAGAGFPHLRTISYGASPISEDVLRRAQATFGCDFVQFYGMTESAGGGTYLAPGAHAEGALLRSCGKPWPDTEVAILNPAGEVLPPHEIGEIAIRGDIVMQGYWRRPDATADTVRDGWLRTGDAGFTCERGYFYVHDRIKDMIVSGGENVYPAEVENAILGCPGVADVAVIGVPDDKWGEAVKAIIVPEGTPDPGAIAAWARERIAAYKVPKSFDFAETLPRNASGKILRRELRAQFWEGRDRGVG
ncbi:MAG TPA: long-chain-fatty-acid--CoA ligase [Sphingomonas sp.]